MQVWVPAAVLENVAQHDVVAGFVKHVVLLNPYCTRLLWILMVSVPFFGSLLLIKNRSVFYEFGSRGPPGALLLLFSEGSGAQEPDSMRFLMKGGRDDDQELKTAASITRKHRNL